METKTNTSSGKTSAFREFWEDYHSEVWFGVVLAVIVGASTYASRFIPNRIFDVILTPALNVATFATAFFGAWLVFRHTDGLRLRRLWLYALLIWGLGDLCYLACYLVAPMKVMNMGAEHLTTYELFFGNLLGWLMTLYPTETLRPGWLNWKIVLWQLLPMTALVALDYIVPMSLWPIIAFYPYVLLIVVLTHIRAYRRWCEDNYSSMENIDVQWVIRYCIMLFIIGANYVYMCFTNGHTRAFTQEWFIIFMLAYSTEQILFRKNPWEGVSAAAEEEPETGNDADRERLDAWMDAEKPYCNPDFKLMDLRAVLPMNRTYLSHFINNTYGCTFFQYVNRYRIEEAKRLMEQHPEMKMTEVATLSGFSSRNVFSHIFSRETGITPKEWSMKCNIS
jgi:AraC-like DNA-binding protein